jgi:hypothetical protein
MITVIYIYENNERANPITCIQLLFFSLQLACLPIKTQKMIPRKIAL